MLRFDTKSLCFKFFWNKSMFKQNNIAIIYVFLSLHCNDAVAQWSPAGSLLNVPINQDCSQTVGNIAMAKSDGLFLCQAREDLVNAQVKDASHFYVVREYGLLAIKTTSDRLADCWAAHQLAGTPNGKYYIKQWITHWCNFGANRPSFGTTAQRIANVRACCACGI